MNAEHTQALTDLQRRFLVQVLRAARHEFAGQDNCTVIDGPDAAANESGWTLIAADVQDALQLCVEILGGATEPMRRPEALQAELEADLSRLPDNARLKHAYERWTRSAARCAIARDAQRDGRLDALRRRFARAHPDAAAPHYLELLEAADRDPELTRLSAALAPLAR
jgi:hypothetical protein